jgi:hypothetical protein
MVVEQTALSHFRDEVSIATVIFQAGFAQKILLFQTLSLPAKGVDDHLFFVGDNRLYPRCFNGLISLMPQFGFKPCLRVRQIVTDGSSPLAVQA